MYKEVLDVIYKYTFNKEFPNSYFIDHILDIIIDNDELDDYIKDIEYNYQSSALASYFYENKILKFNTDKILEESINLYQIYNKIYDNDSFNEYFFLCLSFLDVIYHEVEHVIQNKKMNTYNDDSFEKELIYINNIAVDVYPRLYKKYHDLFSIEREANINSCNKIRSIISNSEIYFKYSKNIFDKKYNKLISEYYTKNSFPLLKFLTIIRVKLLYDDILINKNNTNIILKRTKKNMSLEDRIIKGLPLDKHEYHSIKNKGSDVYL